MNQAASQGSTRRIGRAAGAAALAAAVLVACGGEVVALVAIVTPLAGFWAASGSEAVQFDTDNDRQLFQSKLDVTGQVFSGSGACGATAGAAAAVQGTLDDGALVLRPAGAGAGAAPCLRGRFASLVRLDVEGDGVRPARAYLNFAVFVELDTGRWVGPGGAPVLKFDVLHQVGNDQVVAVSGCDVTTATKVAFNGTLHGFDTAANANPVMPELRSTATGAVLFSQVRFVSGNSLQLRNAAGQAVTLQRQPDPAGTTCV